MDYRPSRVNLDGLSKTETRVCDTDVLPGTALKIVAGKFVLAFLLLLGLRSGRPQFRREAMGFRLDIRPYPYSGCHATAGPLLRSSLHHCTNHEA